MKTNQDFIIEEELKKLPAKPGVYLMHDADDEILYVGKAVSLKNRVRSYFRKHINRGPKIDAMVQKIQYFEYIVTDTELEALVLESNLIKEHRPKYNTMLMDDKSYPYIKVTVNETYPRIILVRRMEKDGCRYYGPFTNVTAVRDTIDLLRKLYHIRPCQKKILPEETEACLYYHIGQCSAPCRGKISREAYQKAVNEAISFLNGHADETVKELTEKMQKASEAMQFEEAAVFRDLIESIHQITEKQKISGTDGDDRDVMAIAVNTQKSAVQTDYLASDCVVQVFFVRGGRLLGREHFYLNASESEDPGILLGKFISQYYSGTPYIPKTLMLPFDIEDRTLLEAYLTQKKGSKVEILIPRKGMKEKLVEMAAENARLVLDSDRERLRRNELRTVGAVQTIASWLDIPSADRMEAYDISNISGYESVGSMIVYEKGKPKRTDYRKFRIKNVQGPNDYASMEEILTRRFQRAVEGSYGFERLPDLILMDGGKGQVNIAESVLDRLGLSIAVCGMVKDDNHRTRGLYFHNRELPIDHSSEAFHLITRIQDEAHRFAIEYHRLLRSKGQVHSVLDEIHGIGTQRRRALMRYFKTIEAVKNADVETLAGTPSMNTKAAQAVYDYFHDRSE